METLHIEAVSDAAFSEMENAWQNLLYQSNVDKLFLSWHWMHNWWTLYRNPSDELLVLTIIKKGVLIGIAPLYISIDTTVKYLPNIRRVMFLGTAKQGFSGFRTEYLEIISTPPNGNDVCSAVFAYIRDRYSLDELFMIDVVVNSCTYTALDQLVTTTNCHKRIQSKNVSYLVDTQGSFEEYLKTLGKNSRLQIYNRRKNLQKLGKIELVQLGQDAFEDVFSLISNFHSSRWDNPIVFDTHKLFVRQLSKNAIISATGFILKVDENIIGASFDIKCGSSIYNFQLGFQDMTDQKLSIGLITLGYALENCFAASDITAFDLLAGNGKLSNYKSRIASEGIYMESAQYVFSTLYKLLYSFRNLYIKFLRR